jgi:prepilin peptidase CpaA
MLIMLDVVLAVAIWFDLRTRKVPNWISLGACAFGLASAPFQGGLRALALSVGGLLALGVLMFIPWSMGGIGGGDVKLAAACGAALGPVVGIQALLLGLAAGGLMIIGMVWWQSPAGFGLIQLRHWGPVVKTKVVYSPALAAGVVLVQLGVRLW